MNELIQTLDGFQQNLAILNSQLMLSNYEIRASIVANSILVPFMSDPGSYPELAPGLELTEIEGSIHVDILEFFEKEMRLKIKSFLNVLGSLEDSIPEELRSDNNVKLAFDSYLAAIEDCMVIFGKMNLAFHFNDMEFLKSLKEEVNEKSNLVVRSQVDLTNWIMRSEMTKPKLTLLKPQDNKKLIL